MPVKPAVNSVSREFFQVFLVTYLLLTLLETYRQGFVSNFFNMNYLLAVVLVSGVAMVLSEPAAARFRKRVARAVVVLTMLQERKLKQAATSVKPVKFRKRVAHAVVVLTFIQERREQ